MKENWKIGSHPSMIVSDTKVRNPPNPEESPDEDQAYYGGHLVCESVANPEHAKLIASAPEMLRLLNDASEIIGSLPVFATSNQVIQDRLEKFAKIKQFLKSWDKQK